MQRVTRSTLFFLVLAGFTVLAHAATYHVDASIGNDNNDGTSPDSAWRTVSKVNSMSLQPGDSVLFRRDQIHQGDLSSIDDGTAGAAIRIGAYGSGFAPVLSRITVDGDFSVVEDLIIDHKKASGDAIRVRGAKNVILRNLHVKNGTNDGIDVHDADNLLIENCHIHHFLNGSFSDQADAHGIVATGTQGLTIRGVEIHHVSGDSFQADPSREAGNITNNVLIENSHFWTAPLDTDFNAGWRMGERPGENAVDTKVVKTGWETEPRMTITLRNITAHGWEKDNFIANKAAFNMKEKIDAVFDGVTVFDSEIAFRVRGGLGNANTAIRNAVVFNVEKAIRTEDDLANLVVHNSTFGVQIDTQLQLAGGDGGSGTWDIRNNSYVGAKPSLAGDPTNLLAELSDFVDSAQNDYRLATGATLIDKGATINNVSVDRDGIPRIGVYDVGAYEFSDGSSTKPLSAPENLRVL